MKQFTPEQIKHLEQASVYIREGNPVAARVYISKHFPDGEEKDLITARFFYKELSRDQFKCKMEAWKKYDRSLMSQ